MLFDEYEPDYPYDDNGRFPATADSGILEPLSTLAFLAGQTSTVRLGTGILLLPQRNPVYTAKEVANIDWLSGGRFDLGIGVGWCKEEFDAVDVSWPKRGKRTDEYIAVMRSLWTEDVSSLLRRVLRAGQGPDVPEAGAGATCRSTSAASPTPPCPGPPAWATAGTRSTACPRTSAPPWPASTSCWTENGRSRADVQISVCPYMHPLTPEMVDRLRRGRRRPGHRHGLRRQRRRLQGRHRGPRGLHRAVPLTWSLERAGGRRHRRGQRHRRGRWSMPVRRRGHDRRRRRRRRRR